MAPAWPVQPSVAGGIVGTSAILFALAVPRAAACAHRV